MSYRRKELDRISGRHILEILIRDSVLYFVVYVLIISGLHYLPKISILLGYSMFATYFTTTMLWVFAPVSNILTNPSPQLI